MILDLLQSTALLLALCLLQGVLARRYRHGGSALAIGSGLIYGLACVAAMMMPITLAPGVIVDPRAVVLSLGALFGGPLAGVVAGRVVHAFEIVEVDEKQRIGLNRFIHLGKLFKQVLPVRQVGQLVVMCLAVQAVA